MNNIYQHYIIDLSSNNNFVQIPTVQGDGNNVRGFEVELIENGVQYEIDKNDCLVCIMGTKPDTSQIMNECKLTDEGNIQVDITSQMSAVNGCGDYQIVLMSRSTNSQLKSFPFYILTTPAAFDIDHIVSSDEFQLLTKETNEANKAIKDLKDNINTFNSYINQAKESKEVATQKATEAANSANSAEFAADKAKQEAEKSSASATVSANSANTATQKANEATASASAAKSSEDNAKTSEENAANSASTATTKANAASTSATNAAASATTAGTKASEAATSASNAAASATTATQKATAAGTSATNAANSATSAENSANTAAAKAGEAADSAESAANSAITAAEKANAASASKDSAAISATNANNYAKKSQSYAVGTGGEFRENDDSDCAEYYYEQTKRISQGFSGVVSMGTITFDELSNPDNQQLNYMFNISDSFVSDNRFADGGGISYGAGSNVVYTAEGTWDVLAAAMVSGVKGCNETEYRQGFVNLTAEDVGALPVDGNAMSATNADKIDGYHISVVSALPSDAASHTDTFYVTFN